MNIHAALIKIRVFLRKAEVEASGSNIAMAAATIGEIAKVTVEVDTNGEGLCSTCHYEQFSDGNDFCDSCDNPVSQWKSKTALIAGNCKVCKHQGVKFNVEPCHSCGNKAGVNNCEAKSPEEPHEIPEDGKSCNSCQHCSQQGEPDSPCVGCCDDENLTDWHSHWEAEIPKTPVKLPTHIQTEVPEGEKATLSSLDNSCDDCKHRLEDEFVGDHCSSCVDKSNWETA